MLEAGDPDPVRVLNQGGSSPLVLIGDHAGVAVPRGLGDLGLGPSDFRRHIALDIGVLGLGEALAEHLDAVFISQAYSRLVIDCNRVLGAPASIVAESDGTVIPGNLHLTRGHAEARAQAVFAPYHREIGNVLDQRAAAGRASILVSLHSFTPSLGGRLRPWRYGVLHLRASPYSRRVLKALQSRLGAEAGDNEPYAMDGTDFTVPFHTDPRNLDYLEIEVRQDLIDAPRPLAAVSLELAEILTAQLA